MPALSTRGRPGPAAAGAAGPPGGAPPQPRRLPAPGAQLPPGAADVRPGLHSLTEPRPVPDAPGALSALRLGPSPRGAGRGSLLGWVSLVARDQGIQKSKAGGVGPSPPTGSLYGDRGLRLLREAWLLPVVPAAVAATSPDSPGASTPAQGRPCQELLRRWSTPRGLALPYAERWDRTQSPGGPALTSAPTWLWATTPPALLTAAGRAPGRAAQSSVANNKPAVTVALGSPVGARGRMGLGDPNS